MLRKGSLSQRVAVLAESAAWTLHKAVAERVEENLLRGRHLDRPRALTGDQLRNFGIEITADREKVASMAFLFGVSWSTLWRAVARSAARGFASRDRQERGGEDEAKRHPLVGRSEDTGAAG